MPTSVASQTTHSSLLSTWVLGKGLDTSPAGGASDDFRQSMRQVWPAIEAMSLAEIGGA